LASRDFDEEGGAPAFLAFEPDASVHGFRKAFADGEAEARAAEAAGGAVVRLGEGLEECGFRFLGDADARVMDFYPNSLWGGGAE